MDAVEAKEGFAGCPRCLLLAREVAALRREVAELKALLGQNSSNSSKPPSSDPPSAASAAKPPTGRKRGGQPGHRGHFRKLLPPERVDRVVRYVPEACRHCRAPLPAEARPDDPPPHRHQVAEIPPLVATITEHQGHARTCARCGGVTRAPVPAEALAHATGPRLSALISYLAGRCHDGRRVVAEFVNDVLGVPLSLGTVCARQREMAEALRPPYEQVRRQVRGSPSKNVDETGWRQGKARRWLWTAASRRAALFAIDASRGWKGLQSVLGRQPRQTGGGKGVVGCDRFPTYEPLGVGNTQLCWSHLKREFLKWSEPGGHSTAMMDLGEVGLGVAKRVLGLWREFRGGAIARRTLRRKAGPLRRTLRSLLARGAKRRLLRDRKGSRFCGKLLAREPALWTFLRVEKVEPTNNHAERCLRPAVMWRKNSFGCDSEGGCRFVERMLTAVTTLRLRGKAVFDYLERALRCHRVGLPAPPILT